ncbi:Tetratricopeptide repeat protein [Clostridiales bacterium CHKCI001]|nr:Tetratricopeptide repeat protein [Clostridiales bacterium CHKCI001]
MDINQVLIEYDQMFGKYSLQEIENFLTVKIKEAYEQKEYFAAVTLLNEIMGFCRDTGQKEKGIGYCEQVIQLMKELQLEKTVEYATTLLNVANAYRAFGRLEQSMKNYQYVEKIYTNQLPFGSFHYASLYNNWSLLYQEMGDFRGAEKMLQKALQVVDQYPEAIIEQATTRTNLAVTLLRISCEENDKSEEESQQIYNRAMDYLRQALDRYEKDGGQNFHYSAALSAMGDALYMKENYRESVQYYNKAMKELERHVGKTDAYRRIEQNYKDACKKSEELLNRKQFHNNMERCKAFYEQYGKNSIREQFPEYENRIAVGLVGQGSDCFGFDDVISGDHDYEIGFCMWLCKEDYEKIGNELRQAYEKLVLEHESEFYDSSNEEYQRKRKVSDSRRKGVFSIDVFYEQILGIPLDFECLKENGWKLSKEQWKQIPEQNLAVAVNGTVFRDDLGIFTAIREKIKAYYPESVWMLKLADQIHQFSQNGQYNYARMMARNDFVTAQICVAQAMKHAMSIAYILSKTYAPYYKWMRKGLEYLPVLSELGSVLDEIAVMENQASAWKGRVYHSYERNCLDSIVVSFEKIAALILSELNQQKIVNGTELFLDEYCKEIVVKAADRKEELIERIIQLEWSQFDKVKNEDGRADCQDDWNTFSLMRKSQYLAWTKELLNSYCSDLMEADRKGWNLIMEKYARMMESTSAERYAKIKDHLPERSKERIAIQEEIIKIQVEWMEAFAKKYPNMAKNARSIHSHEDTLFNTSYETYLRGELGTYSRETLILYGRFIVSVKQQGENLAYIIMNHTAKLYGYKSVEDAENKLT